MTTFRPNPRLRRWLGSEDALTDDVPTDWDGWLLRRMNQGEIVTVGGILVDRAILRQRFACVSERCAPRPGRGSWKSCCADVVVGLDPGEQRRLKGVQRELGKGGQSGGCLARPDGRCFFSRIDKLGRIRCRLHAAAKAKGVDRSDIQPLSCRLFPLIVLDYGQGRTALTLVQRGTYRMVNSYPPSRYPCLSDPTLPALWRSLASDLDWVFGKGFAKALGRRAE